MLKKGAWGELGSGEGVACFFPHFPPASLVRRVPRPIDHRSRLIVDDLVLIHGVGSAAVEVASVELGLIPT